MDSITQATLGAAIGEALLGRKLGWKGALWGAFFGTLPDLDLLFYPFLDRVDQIYWHRGISHSILLMFVGAFVCGPLLWRRWKRGGGDVSVSRAILFVFLVWSTHVGIDCFTTFGTSVFEPFSGERVWWNIMAIIDPLYTLPMIAGLILSVGMWRGKEKRWLPNVVGIVISLLYVGFSIFMKLEYVTPHFHHAMKSADAKVVAVSPMILNTILWRGLGETEKDYLIGLYSPNDTDGEIQFERVAKNRELAEPFLGSREFEAINWFSRGIWSAQTAANGRVRIVDRRFTDMRLEVEEKKVFVPLFVWEFWEKDGEVKFEKVPFDRKNMKVIEQLRDLWNRILGEETH